MKKVISILLSMMLAVMMFPAFAEAEDKTYKAGDQLEVDVVLSKGGGEIASIGIVTNGAPVVFVSAVGGDVNDTVPPQDLDGRFVVINANGLALSPDGTTLNGGSDYTVAGLQAGKIGTLTFAIAENAVSGDYTVTFEVLYGECTVESSVSFTVEGLDRVPGDVNDDGEFTPLDGLRMLKWLAGWNVVINEANADVNGDGSAGPLDALRMLKVLAGWEGVVLE